LNGFKRRCPTRKKWDTSPESSRLWGTYLESVINGLTVICRSSRRHRYRTQRPSNRLLSNADALRT